MRRCRSRGSEAICRGSEQFSAHTDSNIREGAEGKGHWTGHAPWCKLIRVSFEQQQLVPLASTPDLFEGKERFSDSEEGGLQCKYSRNRLV